MVEIDGKSILITIKRNMFIYFLEKCHDFNINNKNKITIDFDPSSC